MMKQQERLKKLTHYEQWERGYAFKMAVFESGGEDAPKEPAHPPREIQKSGTTAPQPPLCREHRWTATC